MATIEPTDELPEDAFFDTDKVGAPKAEDDVPLYRVYEGSKIPVSKAVGTTWKKRLDAAQAAYELVYKAWDESFKYYNNNQTKELDTPRGVFKRGDSTENVVYSNLNTMLPAVYSQDPEITVNSGDDADEDFVSCMKSLLNALIRSRHLIYAKPKIRKAVGLALLTNFGVLKIDYTKKDDSREQAIQAMQELTTALETATDSVEVESIFGRIDALERCMEVYKPSGFDMSSLLPNNLIIDPYAEDPEALDAGWMIERVFLKTDTIMAQYTKPSELADEDDEDKGRVLVYKPTHKAAFSGSEGKRDDGLGMVLSSISGDDVQADQDDSRRAFRDMYYSECYMVWDKSTRRVMLYHRDDWTYPLWVWDDPLKITRFFPYFIIGFGLSTGGTVSVGETAYYLDQQDEINDINRQVSRIRRSIFNFFFYNSDATNPDEIEKLFDAIRGKEGAEEKHVVGIRAGEKKISDMVEAFMPPSLGQLAEPLFNKEPVLNTINRISNTSDALRGTQFKTNTNVAAVQSYQDAARMAVGAKIDVIEDVVSDMVNAIAEIAVQEMDEEQVAGIVGKTQAAKWRQMSVEEFRASYNMQVVAGTTEKPNSAFKKKEAIQIAQSIGQFASAAPMTSMTLMIRVLEQAFTEVVMKPEDWDMLTQEVQANMTKGVSTPSPGQPPGATPPAGGGGDDIKSQLMNLPENIKQQVVAMKQGGKSNDEIKQFLMSHVGKGGGQPAMPTPAPTKGQPHQRAARVPSIANATATP